MIHKLSTKLTIPQKSIVKVLTLLCQHPKIENRDLLCQSELPETTLKLLLKELRDYLEKPSKYVALNRRGREEFKNIEKYQFDEKLFSGIVSYISDLRQKQPKPKRKWDQFLATPETVARRVKLLFENWDIQNKRALFLGDSDLTSLAIIHSTCHPGTRTPPKAGDGVIGSSANFSSFSKTALTNREGILSPFNSSASRPRSWLQDDRTSGRDNGDVGSITTLDIDKELLDFIGQNDKQQTIDLIHHDLRQNLQKHLQNQFDTVFTDPPYTEQGMILFLSRAVEMLRKNILSRLYFCFGTSYKTPEKTLKIQEILNEMNLVIEEKYLGFNQYEGAYSIGSRSDLYVCSLTEKSRAIVRGGL